MSTKKENPNKEIIKLFSGQGNSLTVPKIYYKLTRCLNKALLLNQIIFYSSISTYCKDEWFYKSYQEWLQEIFVSERTLRTYIKEFEKDKYIETYVGKVDGIRTIFFRPNMDVITEAITKFIQEERLEKDKSDPSSDEIREKIAAPKRQKMPDSQTAKIAVSYSIYTDEKDQITTTAKTEPQSSSFFSEKQKTQILDFKLPTDLRTEENFLQECEKHIVDQINEFSKLQRVKGLKDILQDMRDAGKHFKAKSSQQQEKETVIQETHEQKLERWRLERERNGFATPKPDRRTQCSVPKSVKENFSNLASILGSRPNLSQHAY